MFNNRMAETSIRIKCGGKGNLGMFIERDTRICAAGLPTLQPEQSVKDNFKAYSLQDKVDALMKDTIKPVCKSKQELRLNKNKERDMRNAGIFSEGSQLISPPVKTKFQTIVEDLKETAFKSYWKKEVGSIPDPVPSLPQGFELYNTTLGKKTETSDNLYEVIMPIHARSVEMRPSKKPGYQINRNYCSFNTDAVFGHKTYSDPSGKLVKSCLTSENVLLGTSLKIPITMKQAQFQDTTASKLSLVTTANNNIQNVPKGFTFGKVIISDNDPPVFLRICEKNSYKELINECLGHLNTLRNNLAKRFDEAFFKHFYLNLKYLDSSRSGWLEKQLIYKQCNARFIRFNPSLIEPLLEVWNAFDGSHIEYKNFVRIINFREPSPELPKIDDAPEKKFNVQTTYGEMTESGQMLDKNKRAGVPSGRYLVKDYPLTPDGYCKADRSYFPEESDMKSCLNPSMFTLFGVSHRDMYAKQDSNTIRKILENSGEHFDDKVFKDIWEIAEKYHSLKWVCLETFRRSLIEYKMKKKLP